MLEGFGPLTIGLLASLPGNVQPLRAGEPNPVTAIDIMLEPDATMIEHAKAANQRLLKGFPIGFSHHVFAAVRRNRQALRGRWRGSG